MARGRADHRDGAIHRQNFAELVVGRIDMRHVDKSKRGRKTIVARPDPSITIQTAFGAYLTGREGLRRSIFETHPPLSKESFFMCRNIKTLANFDPPATDDEIRASALQFVRKLSGTSRPSRANEAVFNQAVDDVTAIARRLVHSLEIH